MFGKPGILLMAILLLSAFMTKGQTGIHGKITDKNTGEALVGVSVYLPDFSSGTVSDVKGNYVLKALRKGEIRVQFSYVGFKTRMEKVNFTGENIQLDIDMQATVINSEEVVISGSFAGLQHDNVLRISTIKPTEIQRSGSPSFMETIAEVPGVSMISKGPGVATPVIRGLSLSNLVFLNNGVPMESFQFSENHPFMVDEYGIERVEIIKGPASLLYGSGAVGGVINIIKAAPPPRGTVRGDFNLKYFSNTEGVSSNLGVDGAKGDLTFGIRGGVNSNRDYYDGSNERVPNTRFNRNSFKATAGFIKPYGSFRFFYDYNKDDLGMSVAPALLLVAENGRKNDVWYQDLTNHVFSSQNKFFVHKLKFDLNVAYQMNNRKLHGASWSHNPIDLLVDMDLNTFSYTLKTNIPANEKTKFIVGIQGLNQNNKNHEAPDHVVPDASMTDFSVFAVGRRDMGEKLMMELGMRFDYRLINVPSSKVNGPRGELSRDYQNVNASSGAVYNISEKMQFRLNLASAFRSPNLAELTQDGVHGTRYEKGNPELQSQRNLEADFDFHLHSSHTTLDISGFYNNVFNYIFLAPSNDSIDNVLIYQYDQENARLYGGEAMLHIHPHPLDWLHLKTSYSYVLGQQENGDYLPFIPAQKIHFEIELQKKSWKGLSNLFFKMGSDFVFPQDNPAPFESKTPGYTLLNMSIGTDIAIVKQKMNVSINANNLLDETYIPHLSTLKDLGLNNMGRNITFAVRVPFGILR
ncbi:MAG: TonB-dependent receptor [Chlorobi bacterium]|nr:TonB-dependent receptor [Chlorobiota bacterium]